jgi:hypothetical protein
MAENISASTSGRNSMRSLSTLLIVVRVTAPMRSR